MRVLRLLGPPVTAYRRWRAECTDTGPHDYVSRWRALWAAPVVIDGVERVPAARRTQDAKPELLRLSPMRERYRAGRRRA